MQRPPAEPVQTEAATAHSNLDDAIAIVRTGSERWGALSPGDRASLLAEVHLAMASVRESWTRTACELKGIDPDSPVAGEEWMSGPYAAIAAAGALTLTLTDIAEGRSPLHDVTIEAAPGGRVRARVLPHSKQEWVLFHGFSAEVWSTPGVDARTLRADAGLGAAHGYGRPGVSVVLGAGNITSIAPLDVLGELVAHGRGVVLKLNPVLGGMMTVLGIALWPLIRDGYLRIVQGGLAEGEYLTSHPGVDHIHITGSERSHDAIVWGVGDEAESSRSTGATRITATITSELGGVSPIIIVPGRWSKADLRFQAEHVATMRMHNAGHNCIAGQVIVVSSEWEQRDEFADALRQALHRAPGRPPWYAGAAERLEEAATKEGAEQLGPSGERVLLRAPDAEQRAWLEQEELFATVLGIVELPGRGAAFLETAIEYANERLDGSLGANVLCDPRTLRAIGDEAFDSLLADLAYGSIAVNAWTAVAFLTPTATWGAFPGNDVQHVGSGIGIVHNALLIDHAERTVVRGPFRPFPRSVAGGELAAFPKPPWFVGARTAAATGRLLTGYATAATWAKLPGVFASAFRA